MLEIERQMRQVLGPRGVNRLLGGEGREHYNRVNVVSEKEAQGRKPPGRHLTRPGRQMARTSSQAGGSGGGQRKTDSLVCSKLEAPRQ